MVIQRTNSALITPVMSRCHSLQPEDVVGPPLQGNKKKRGREKGKRKPFVWGQKKGRKKSYLRKSCHVIFSPLPAACLIEEFVQSARGITCLSALCNPADEFLPLAVFLSNRLRVTFFERRKSHGASY